MFPNIYKYIYIIFLVTCGFHTLFLTKCGELFFCGNNLKGEGGQGHNSNSGMNKVKRIYVGGYEENEKVVGITGSYYTSFAKTEPGNFYSWGSNEHGQISK